MALKVTFRYDKGQVNYREILLVFCTNQHLKFFFDINFRVKLITKIAYIAFITYIYFNVFFTLLDPVKMFSNFETQAKNWRERY